MVNSPWTKRLCKGLPVYVRDGQLCAQQMCEQSIGAAGWRSCLLRPNGYYHSQDSASNDFHQFFQSLRSVLYFSQGLLGPVFLYNTSLFKWTKEQES